MATTKRRTGATTRRATPRTSPSATRKAPAGDTSTAKVSSSPAARAATPRASTARGPGATRSKAAPADSASTVAPRAASPAPGASPALAKPHERWVRQSCKLTEAEYGTLSRLKKRSAALARPMKRGELLRVGLQVLAALDDAALFAALDHASIPRRAARRVTGASSD